MKIKIQHWHCEKNGELITCYERNCKECSNYQKGEIEEREVSEKELVDLINNCEDISIINTKD